jgi:division protein CdvB (Snf7/Vps24/ESCRT-III family)
MIRETQFTQECTDMLKCWYKPWMDIAELNTRMFSEFTDNTKLTKRMESLTRAKSLDDVFNTQAELLNQANSMTTQYMQDVMDIFAEHTEEMKQHFNKLNEECSSAASEWMQTTQEAAHKFTPPKTAKAKKTRG